jgi:hypothetical protein
MTFNNISSETNCTCINDAFEDPNKLYARKIGKSGSIPKDRDFKSYWEGGKRPDNLSDCQLVCSYKGVSVNPWNDTTRDFVIDLYTQSVRITPKHEKKICIFKLDSEGGKYRHTPEKGNDSHHDLIKSDQFTIEKIQCQEMIPINV